MNDTIPAITRADKNTYMIDKLALLQVHHFERNRPAVKSMSPQKPEFNCKNLWITFLFLKCNIYISLLYHYPLYGDGADVWYYDNEVGGYYYNIYDDNAEAGELVVFCDKVMLISIVGIDTGIYTLVSKKYRYSNSKKWKS